MRIAMISPVAWRTPPRHYGPWEQIVSVLTEGLVNRGIDVTLFATGDSLTRAKLHAVCPRPYEEDKTLDGGVCTCLHVSEVFERANQFDIIHNHFDFLPLTYSGLVETPVVTTVHGFSSEKILSVYEKYNGRVYYVSISNASRLPNFRYLATVYHGIDLRHFPFSGAAGDYLLFFGRIHPDKGVHLAIEIARKANMPLLIAGIIHDRRYFEDAVEPHIDGVKCRYLGSLGPDERGRVLSGAYALLHPICIPEPFGLSVVEAMACGTPVIAFNQGAMPELIAQGKTGFLVCDVEEAVRLLPEIRGLSRTATRAWVEEHFSAEQMVAGYIQVYQQILKDNAAEDRRPWGYYKVLLNEPSHKVKQITVYPGKRLSLQRHRYRSEHWYVVDGECTVVVGDEQKRIKVGESIDIPRGTKHRLENCGEACLVVIEVQQGEYLGEDDIERLADDYGRTALDS